MTKKYKITEKQYQYLLESKHILGNNRHSDLDSDENWRGRTPLNESVFKNKSHNYAQIRIERIYEAIDEARGISIDVTNEKNFIVNKLMAIFKDDNISEHEMEAGNDEYVPFQISVHAYCVDTFWGSPVKEEYGNSIYFAKSDNQAEHASITVVVPTKDRRNREIWESVVRHEVNHIYQQHKAGHPYSGANLYANASAFYNSPNTDEYLKCLTTIIYLSDKGEQDSYANMVYEFALHAFKTGTVYTEENKPMPYKKLEELYQAYDFLLSHFGDKKLLQTIKEYYTENETVKQPTLVYKKFKRWARDAITRIEFLYGRALEQAMADNPPNFKGTINPFAFVNH